MGTNYYYMINICGSCKRHERVHVGKSSAGWAFAFRGYEHELVSNYHPDWGYKEESPFGKPVLSRDDWIDVFKNVDGVLVNEYDEEIKDPLHWIRQLRLPTVELIAWEDGHVGTSGLLTEEKIYRRDQYGFRIITREFS